MLYNSADMKQKKGMVVNSTPKGKGMAIRQGIQKPDDYGTNNSVASETDARSQTGNQEGF